MNRYIILLTVAIATLNSCKENKKETRILASKEVQVDQQAGECPYLTKDSRGNTVLSWVRIINDSTTAFCYAVSKDGKSFGSPVVIPNSNNIQPHGENLPKIIFKPSGEIIALWGAGNPNPRNKYSGLVFYVQSFDEGKTWNKPRPLITDTSSFDQRYYDVALLPNGEAGILWLDNRKTNKKDGSGLYFATTKGRNGFQDDRMISQSCCQCCRTDLFIDSKGNIHALYRAILDNSIRDMVHIVSTDGGNSFSNPQRISNDNWMINGCPHTGPAMTENKDGIHFAWFTGGENGGCYYTKSTDNGKTFSDRDSVSSLGSHPQLAPVSNGELIIVWDEAHVVDNKPFKKIGIQRRSADGKTKGKEYITADDSIASYPVVTALNEKSSVIAYTKTDGNKSYVAYKVVSLK
ncbi:MAG: sialidase family protein [Flavisolibacter sp.]